MHIKLPNFFSGFTLFEVIFSLLILSVLLLGLDAMQIISLYKAKEAYYFSVATSQLNVMVERLRLSKGNDLNDVLAIWNNQNQHVLPEGRGTVSGHYPNFKLEIFWGSKDTRLCHQNKIGRSGCLRFTIKSQIH